MTYTGLITNQSDYKVLGIYYWRWDENLKKNCINIKNKIISLILMKILKGQVLKFNHQFNHTVSWNKCIKQRVRNGKIKSWNLKNIKYSMWPLKHHDKIKSTNGTSTSWKCFLQVFCKCYNPLYSWPLENSCHK